VTKPKHFTIYGEGILTDDSFLILSMSLILSASLRWGFIRMCLSTYGFDVMVSLTFHTSATPPPPGKTHHNVLNIASLKVELVAK